MSIIIAYTLLWNNSEELYRRSLKYNFGHFSAFIYIFFEKLGERSPLGNTSLDAYGNSYDKNFSNLFANDKS